MEKWSLRLLALAFLAPAVARADPPATVVVFGAPAETLAVVEPTPATLPPAPAAPRACPPAVTVTRRFGGRRERVRMPLLDCEGAPREEARRALSILARPRSLSAPSDDEIRAWRDAGGDPAMLTAGVRLLHPGLLERLQRIGDAFSPHPIEIVSGYRPDSRESSRHHHGRALDLVVSGVSLEALRDLAVTLPQTGVGWYPNSVFVHVDVREQSAYWVDLSGPGERPRYVRGAEPPAPPAHDGGSAPAREALDRFRREADEALRAIRVPLPR